MAKACHNTGRMRNDQATQRKKAEFATQYLIITPGRLSYEGLLFRDFDGVLNDILARSRSDGKSEK
jgi:hypothetical protein